VDLASGTEFAGYRIERTLGRGGMGVVYLAEHERLKRKVALKVLAPELADDERFRERFIRESELAASLDQPNVLPVYDAGEQEGHLFIAMRYVEGADLRELIDESPIALDDVLTVVADVARALDAAHAKGLVHRDMKPGNILIARSSGSRTIEHVYLADFGLTKRSSSRSALTGTGVFVGTLDYAAPEQFEGKPLSPRTDVYSLGCVLFECLVGEPPFRRGQDAAVMYAHLHDPPPSATARRPEVPRGVDRVIEKAMAKRPVDRYATADELAAALTVALAGERLPELKGNTPQDEGVARRRRCTDRGRRGPRDRRAGSRRRRSPFSGTIARVRRLGAARGLARRDRSRDGKGIARDQQRAGGRSLGQRPAQPRDRRRWRVAVRLAGQPLLRAPPALRRGDRGGA
jgi:serine/threonine-protein kinase